MLPPDVGEFAAEGPKADLQTGTLCSLGHQQVSKSFPGN